MSIRSLPQGFKNIIKPQPQRSLELLLFPAKMKNRDLLRKSPQADFFLEISYQIAKKSRQEIHSYFDEYNIQLNLEFANWLNDWGKARFVDGHRHSKIEEILDALNATWDYPRGNRAGNLEVYLVANQLQLLFINHENDPKSWAVIQNNRANAYSERIKGDRAENLELAINGYENALVIGARRDFPIQRATIENNLATAYKNRIKGNKADNLEKAINGYESALMIRTREDFPVRWAMTQNNLATVYKKRTKGDRADNLELAIKGYESALEIYTKKEFPIDWAMTQNNRALAYSDRIKGDRAKNLEKAIKGYELALEIYTKKDFPIDWAMTQNNRALAYSDKIKGGRAYNLEKAIEGYELALEIYTKKEFPIDWAMTQNNRALAYGDRIKGNRAENLEKAIEGYENALEIRTKESFPIDWATTQNNRAAAYSDRIKGDRGDNLEQAIEGFENALPIIAKSGFLQQLEIIKNSLANAYLQRVDSSLTKDTQEQGSRSDRTNYILQQLTQNCLDQADWYIATISLSLWSKALISQKATTQAAQPLLQAISLDIQHNPQLVDTDLQELASLMTQLDWQPEILPVQWQIANSTLPLASPLTPQLQAQICFTIGVVSIQKKYWYKGLDWLKACWEIQQTIDSLAGLAEVSYQLAIGHHIASNLSYAGIYYRDAQRIFQHLNDHRKVAFCHHGLGRLLLQLGKVESAISEFDRALTIYNTIPEQPQVPSRISDIHYYKRIIIKMQDPTLTHQTL